VTAWSGSTRKARLPANWAQLRRLVLERDGWQCTATDPPGRRCGRPARQVDHITPGDDHTPANLRALCDWHHARKSSAEGNASRWRVKEKREPERHPGLI
jgi:hypothetical protein